MSRSQYYSEMRQLAASKRIKYGIATANLKLSVMNKIYKAEGIRIDRRNHLSSKLRAAYFCDEIDSSVLLNSKLPVEPKLFCLAHELKHHYVDRNDLMNGEIQCGSYNANQEIEIGAEIFAAEFIFPENEMLALLSKLEVTRENCDEKSVILIKRSSPVAISYIFIVKRLEWFGLISKGKFQDTQFKKLEESIFGIPFYKQDWYKRSRTRSDSKRN